MMKTTDNAILEKSKSFALRIIRLYQYLSSHPHEYVLSKQILRSGTSIGANVNEAQCAQSPNDFYSKLYIAYKEAAETRYWLDLLYAGKYLESDVYNSILQDSQELICLLASITKHSKKPPH